MRVMRFLLISSLILLLDVLAFAVIICFELQEMLSVFVYFFIAFINLGSSLIIQKMKLYNKVYCSLLFVAFVPFLAVVMFSLQSGEISTFIVLSVFYVLLHVIPNLLMAITFLVISKR